MASNGHDADTSCCGPGYASPKAAMAAPREKLLYAIGLYTGTGVDAPDYLATVDVDPASSTYSQVIHRLAMPNIGDELHHFGWNACSSLPRRRAAERRFLIVPGFESGRIHIVDTADPRAPEAAQGDRAGGGDRARPKPDRAAHRPLPGDGRDHDLDARRRGGRRAGRLPRCWTRSSRSPAAGKRTWTA